jgi:hypothetical protein
MSGRDAFFVGWAAALDAGLRRFLLPVAAGLLLGLPLLGLLLGAAATDPADARFGSVPGRIALADLPSEQALRGVLLDGPYPLLHLPADSAHPKGRTLLLSGDGKRGPALDMAALAGRYVAVEGFVLRRGSIEMLLLDGPPRVIAEAPAAMLPSAEPLGRWRITGEICDGKCAAGAMRPGIGIGHRACATLCLDGALPAIFVATHPVAGHAFLLLADREGRAGLPAFRDLVAQRVTLEGAVERRGDLLVFRAEAP